MFSSESNEWGTPQDLFNQLNLEFNFTLDPCATNENHKCDKFYTIIDDGLSKSWEGETVFVNPPYGRDIGNWVKKCHEENINNKTTCVMLIPARTDTKYFHKYIYNQAEIRFIEGRIKFVSSDTTKKLQAAPFPSMIVVFREV
jgi:site-specific DNA-methyltransferase (adenine-specific)